MRINNLNSNLTHGRVETRENEHRVQTKWKEPLNASSFKSIKTSYK